MATGPGFGTNVGFDFTYACATDMSANQFKFVVISSGHIVLCGAGAVALGVQQDNPNGATTATSSQVRTLGPSKIVCGSGSFVAGDLVSSDSSGRAVKYTAASVFTGTPYTVSGTQVLGVANEPGGSATGSITSMLFRPSGLSA